MSEKKEVYFIHGPCIKKKQEGAAKNEKGEF
jgi:hypothetical protein